MNRENANFRLRLAQGFLNEGLEDLALKRWRSAVDNGQLAVENAVKAVLGLVGPVGKTHHPALPLRQALNDELYPARFETQLRRLIELSEKLGFEVHVQTDYGDELEGQTPWDIFDKDDAQSAVEIANEAVELAQNLIGELLT
jgi:HEPN domain-containing protein